MSFSTNTPTTSPTLSLDFANTRQLDARITFTRASTGTYYNNVTTTKAEENLLLQSQNFATTWVKTNTTVTADSIVAPDGTSTADTAAATDADGTVGQNFSGLALGDYTLSVWIKRKTGSGNVQLAFQVGLGYTTVAVTSDWQRFSITKTITASNPTANIRIQTSGDEVYIWGAQLEQRSTVTSYTPTTTQPITNYIPVLLTAQSDVARFDCNPVTRQSYGLLMEEQRTNLLTYSEQFDNAAWNKTNISITSNTIVAPDGTLTGDKLVENTANGEHAVNQIYSFTSGLTYTQTIYAKAAERTLIRVGAGNPVTWAASVIVDLTTGTVTDNTAGTAIVQSVGNGWYRISITGTALATASTGVATRMIASGTSITYTGNGYSGIYIWGAQFEAGAFPTSYIPTVASQATRAVDTFNITGSNFSGFYNIAEGTLYSETIYTGGLIGTATSTNIVQLNNIAAAADNFIQMRIVRSPTSPQADLYSKSNGTTYADTSGIQPILANTICKRAVGYATNNASHYVNGTLDTTDTSYVVPICNRLAVNSFNGTIAKIAYYPYRCTNTQLQSLTVA